MLAGQYRCVMSGKADIKLGYTCNNHCIHCVIATQAERARAVRGNVDRSSREFRRELADAHARGLTDIVFTGGEPTIRKDLPALMEEAAALGFRLHVQTNGRMLSYRPLAERLATFDATYVIALHGATAEVHDRITEVAGSYEQTLAGIRNLVELGQRVVGKTVISRHNVPFLPEIAGQMVEMGLRAVNMAFPHALGRAEELFDEVVPRYRDVAPYVHATADRYGDALPLFFEAIPLCFMRGYERFVAEYACEPLRRPAVHKQLDMDTRDWRSARREQKRKFPQCARCSLEGVCEGVWREYAERFGGDEFVPVEGADS